MLERLKTEFKCHVSVKILIIGSKCVLSSIAKKQLKFYKANKRSEHISNGKLDENTTDDEWGFMCKKAKLLAKQYNTNILFDTALTIGALTLLNKDKPLFKVLIS